jgi:anthranilate synthase/aminodeoxychorismate synthase-like glutamine amidotransferase
MAKFLLIDNRDSFTYNLMAWVMQEGHQCRVLTCDDSINLVQGEEWDAAILGPGPGTPNQAGWLMEFIARYVDSKPMLGICLGHQALGLHFGSTLVRAEKPMHGKTSILVANPKIANNCLPSGCPVVDALDGLEVMRYHSLVLDAVPSEFELLARAQDDESVQAMRHCNRPLWGYQFHPESILSQKPDLLLSIFLQSLNQNS